MRKCIGAALGNFVAVVFDVRRMRLKQMHHHGKPFFRLGQLVELGDGARHDAWRCNIFVAWANVDRFQILPIVGTLHYVGVALVAEALAHGGVAFVVAKIEMAGFPNREKPASFKLFKQEIIVIGIGWVAGKLFVNFDLRRITRRQKRWHRARGVGRLSVGVAKADGLRCKRIEIRGQRFAIAYITSAAQPVVAQGINKHDQHILHTG